LAKPVLSHRHLRGIKYREPLPVPPH
jgi:hypothetical protein